MNRRERRAQGKRSPLPGSAGVAPVAPQLLRDALALYEAGRFREADRMCRRVLALDPGSIVALHVRGLAALQTGANEAAFAHLNAALRLNPRIAELHAAVAEALQRLGRIEEAIGHCRTALALDPKQVDALYNGGNLLLRLKRHDEAIAYYKRALALSPGFAEAANNCGSALFAQKRYAEALAAFEHALRVKADFVPALCNRGSVLVELRRVDEGVASFEQALALQPNEVAALAGRGNAFFERREFVEAARDFERVLAIDPDYPYAEGRAFYCRLLNCDWSGYEAALSSIEGKVAAGKRTVIPFMFLNMSDSAAAQLQCARTFSADQFPASADPLRRGEQYEHARMRVAYLSADFRQHPMAYSMAAVFEAHDRTRFETIAISFGPNPEDEIRQRLESAFDRFLDVRTRGDREIALLLRELEVDIAIDLMGYTNNCRPGILAFRPVPVQVNYLGFAGTLGSDSIDYIIADRFVLPQAALPFYSEQVVHLPDTYWPTNSGRGDGVRIPMRAEAGLPGDGFVFCCFNQSYKIAPPVFDTWMRLLRQVDDSVLWLVEDNAVAAQNLRREAQRRGVEPERLVFAPRVGIDLYLARFALADLFLDTLPFNAHTTASDALWSGVPVVTCAGSSFAARVAGSQLNAVGLSELITENLEDYEALALLLARDTRRLAALRVTLAHNRRVFPLFDTAL
ncbi:MAG: tetratricopeptide repeat protein, partial [Alphaproteobacteria bacterium]|nr:tetratricopeptide repeat protein [Alphaproteobacteria bacterium]